jgi:hypothetical protein
METFQMPSPETLFFIVLIAVAIGAFAILVVRGGRTTRLVVGVALLWVISWLVIASFWYERQGNLDALLISLLALIPAVAVGALISFALKRVSPT